MHRALLLLILVVPLVALADDRDVLLEDGDLVFQRSRSAQSAAIAEATGSELTHVGVVFVLEGEVWVYEAVQPVKRTRWSEWVARGDGGRVAVRRLADPQRLGPAQAEAMRALVDGWLGRPYDAAFAWDDARLYCSELVYKLFDRSAGVEVGQRVPIREFHLDGPAVQGRVAQRFGGRVPLDREVVSPQSIWADPDLVTVFSDF